MRERADFGRVLDEKLGETVAWSSPVGARGSASWRPGPGPVFLFGGVTAGFAGSPRPGVTRVPPAWFTSSRPAATPVRPARTLSRTQERALDYLRGLGARTLAADFTDAEIKSAFRALALRFHPDRHPGSSDAERASLARAFASVCDAYRTLTATVH